jgi:arylsulfatase
VDEYGRKQNPYFLYLAYTAPHWPLHALPEDIARYRGRYKRGWDVLRQERHARQLSSGIVERRWPLTPRDPTVPAWADIANQDDYDLRMAVYAAQIDRMDQGIGRVLAKVRQLGQEDNTLVIFVADNGGCHEELDRGIRKGAPVGTADSFTSYGRPWANASNTPFRMYKHWVHEGGIASPLIARWPSAMKRTGSLFHGTGHVTDILPTVLDAAGAAYPRQHAGKEITPLPGKSLLPALKGEHSAPPEWVFWEHQGNRAVRQGDWKLVSRFPERWELYDIAADRTELTDLAPEDPGRVKQMIAAYDDWARRCGVVPWESFKGKR